MVMADGAMSYTPVMLAFAIGLYSLALMLALPVALLITVWVIWRRLRHPQPESRQGNVDVA